jgi:hypothetical protein
MTSLVCFQNENKAKRQKLDSAKSLIEQVAAAAKPAFRSLRLGALSAADTANTTLFPQLPTKLQALYFQIAYATAISSVDAQVCRRMPEMQAILPFCDEPVMRICDYSFCNIRELRAGMFRLRSSSFGSANRLFFR